MEPIDEFSHEEDLFKDMADERPVKGAWYYALISFTAFFMLFVFVELFVDLKRMRIRYFDWQIAGMFLLLPLLALLFQLATKKIGWIIGYFYYTGFFLLVAVGIIKTLTGKIKDDPPDKSAIAIILLVAAILILLILPSTRKFFRINNLVLAITTVLAIISSVLLLYFQ